MKTMIAALLLLISTSVFASSVYVMKNKLGGEIVLTDRECPFPKSEGFLYAYTWTVDARINGCWALLDNTVHVVWDAPQGAIHKEYRARDFTKKSTI